MPRVARFSIAPVRSLGLQHPAEIDLTELGVVEDRRFFLTNDDNRLVDQLIVFKLVQVAARTDPEATTLWMQFPDGTVVDGEVELAEAVETPIHGRTGVGHRVVGPWSEALTDFVGMPMRVIRCDRPGGTRRGNPASILSEGSVRELASHPVTHLAGCMGPGARGARRPRLGRREAVPDVDGPRGRRGARGGHLDREADPARSSRDARA